MKRDCKSRWNHAWNARRCQVKEETILWFSIRRWSSWDFDWDFRFRRITLNMLWRFRWRLIKSLLHWQDRLSFTNDWRRRQLRLRCWFQHRVPYPWHYFWESHQWNQRAWWRHRNSDSKTIWSSLWEVIWLWYHESLDTWSFWRLLSKYDPSWHLLKRSWLGSFSFVKS